MIYYILAVLSLASFLIIAYVLNRQVRLNREKNLNYQSLNKYAVTGFFVDYLAFSIVHFCREVVNKTYLFFVHFTKNCIATVRYLIVRIERKFNRLTANIQSPEAIHKNSKVSFFLKEIKEHKENKMAEIQDAAQLAGEEIEKK